MVLGPYYKLNFGVNSMPAGLVDIEEHFDRCNLLVGLNDLIRTYLLVGLNDLIRTYLLVGLNDLIRTYLLVGLNDLIRTYLLVGLNDLIRTYLLLTIDSSRLSWTRAIPRRVHILSSN